MKVQIFYSALLWLISNYQIRKRYIPRVLGLVRFHIMPPAFLIQWSQILKDLRPELADFLCHHLYNAMLRQHEYYMDFKSEFLGSDNRRWIRDPKCPYANLLNANGDFLLSPNVFISYLRRIQKSPAGFIARLILVESLEQIDKFFLEEDEITINEPSTSKNFTDDFDEQSNVDSEIFLNTEYDESYLDDIAFESTKSDDSYYIGTMSSKSRMRSIAGEDIFTPKGTDSFEDFDFATNVKGETKSEHTTDLAKKKIIYRLYAGGIAKPNIDSDFDSDSSGDPSQGFATTSSTDSLPDSDKGSVHSTVADSAADSPEDSSADSPANSSADSPGILLADSPADSSARSFADSPKCFAGDFEWEPVEDSNADSHPDFTAESATGYATTSAGYSGTGSSVCSRTDSISSEVYETDDSFEYF
ncbi:clumping factor A isoform X2 [Drosophila santomea]|uniref:clumping factor A isoform X2 n=1 Tax=Drosophila santomea TaxID=129105 RepID=UPI001954AAD8|nr:clumping factor A isoform X2 [Drosophila santomea]